MTMHERTHLSQADEALRQATAPSVAAREALLAIAGRLSQVRPDGPMHEPMRMALALRVASVRHGVCTPAADQLEAEILARAPRVARPITRGEYALILQRAAGAVR
jgi:hypothetical protein